MLYVSDCMSLLEPGNRLYHYCNLNTALELILPKRQLLLSPINKTNDPRENKSFVFGSIWNNPKYANSEEWNSKVSEALREDCKVICFSEDNDGFWGYESSRMWAYYGGNHKGVCLLLDKKKFLEENFGQIEKDYLRSINYFKFDYNKPIEHKHVDFTEVDRIGFEPYIKNVFRKDNLDYLYFTKNYEWQSEHEIRLIHFSSNKENEYCSIRNSLSHIFLGVDFSYSYLPSLIKLCPHVDMSKLEFKDVKLIPLLSYQGKESNN